MFKGIYLILYFCLFLYPCFDWIQAKEASKKPESILQAGTEQKINDFSLAGYAEKGKKSWDIHGKTADIFDNVVKLQDITGNLFQDKENVTLTARKGEFDKTDGKVRLESGVVITTTSGAKLTTETLEWDRNKHLVSTKDRVNIERENLVATAVGAQGEPDLNSVRLQNDPVVKLLSAPNRDRGLADEVVISCDGPLEINYKENLAKFNNSVKVDYKGNQIYCDVMELYFFRDKGESSAEASKGVEPLTDTPSFMGSSVDKIICRGNVRIIKGENISYCQEATYTSSDGKIVLTGRPKLVIYSTDDFKAALE